MEVTAKMLVALNVMARIADVHESQKQSAFHHFTFNSLHLEMWDNEGKSLLTLQDCLDAREAIQELRKANPQTFQTLDRVKNMPPGVYLVQITEQDVKNSINDNFGTLGKTRDVLDMD